MYCVSGLQFSCKHNYITAILKIDYRTSQNLFDLVLEYCYGLFQTIKYFKISQEYSILTDSDCSYVVTKDLRRDKALQ